MLKTKDIIIADVVITGIIQEDTLFNHTCKEILTINFDKKLKIVEL